MGVGSVQKNCHTKLTNSMKRSTLDISFYARDSHKNREGLAPVELSIIINGDRRFINLPMKVRPEEFNRKHQPKYIVDYLSGMRVRINEIIADMACEGIPLTADSLREYIRTGGIKSYTVEDLFNDFVALQGKRVGRDLTQQSYRKFELMRDIFFGKIDKEREVTSILPKDIEYFYDELLNVYEPNTAASYMDKVKAVFAWGKANNKVKIDPFQTTKVRREHKDIEYLTEEEIYKIMTTEMPTKSLERVRDSFLLQVFSGLSFIDLESLKAEDIQQEGELYFISKNRMKTGVNYTAVILPEGVDILKKYDYHMPIISNQKTNAALKAIARECGIDKNVYSHLGRKSYGNLLLNGYQLGGGKRTRPVSMEVTARCMGHSTSRTTARYYAALHKDSVLNEMASALQ